MNILKIFLTSFVLLIFCQIAYGGMNNWIIISSDIEVDNNIKIWHSVWMQESETEEYTPVEYSVTISYDKTSLEPAELSQQGKEINSHKVFLGKNRYARLAMWQMETFVSIAMDNPTEHIHYLFILELDDRIRIITNTKTTDNKELPPPDITGEPFELIENESLKELAIALNENDGNKINASPIVQLIVGMISAKSPLATPIETISLEKMWHKYDGGQDDISIKMNETGETELRIKANLNDTITLIPEFSLISYSPTLKSIKSNTQPLPGHAFVKLQNVDGSLRIFGTPIGEPGVFHLGPYSVNDLQKMELTALYPLDPPGNKRPFKSTLLYRNGRPIEELLDNGFTPFQPSNYKDVSMDELNGLIVDQVAKQYNPDLNRVEHIDRAHLLDLYVFAKHEISQFDELSRLIDKLVTLHNEYGFYQNEHSLSPKQWSLEDAWKSFNKPSLASALRDRILISNEPSIWRYPSKDFKDAFTSFDKDDPIAHAIAIMALVNAHDKIFTKVMRSQFDHLIIDHNINSPEDWTLNEIVLTGQAFKFVAYNADDKEIKLDALNMVDLLRKHAFNRLATQNQGSITLNELVDIAQLISPSWRPHIKTPDELRIQKRSDPIQHMAPGPDGRDITFETLEDIRGIYKSAYQRYLAESPASNTSLEDQKAALNNFLDKWHDYLFMSHKGGFLQPYEESLEKDRKDALELLEGK